MLSWALIFLVVAIVAALIGVSGAATRIAWILFIVDLNPGRSPFQRRPAALA